MSLSRAGAGDRYRLRRKRLRAQSGGGRGEEGAEGRVAAAITAKSVDQPGDQEP